jgi:Flp pilus assembly protein TadD
MTRPETAAGTSNSVVSAHKAVRAVAAALVCLTLGACAQSMPGSLDLGTAAQVNESDAASKATGADLAKATETAGKEFAKAPRDPEKALAYARSLKAMGEKRQALAVLQRAAMFNAGHRGLASEYGRLALEFDQISLAQKLLATADDPAKPDWRVISARGTVLAKQGSYREAIPLYERALSLAPDQPSILNNLALAQAMQGHADRAETLLRRAAAADGKDSRVNQNLALVLGLQGKYDEAKTVAARDLPADSAAANVDYVRRMVKLEPRVAAQPKWPPASVAAAPAAAEPALRGSAAGGGAPGWTPRVAVASDTP